MSVAGTKNFDQPPHDSNRTHLVFSTSGLLLGSRAPLVSKMSFPRIDLLVHSDGGPLLIQFISDACVSSDKHFFLYTETHQCRLRGALFKWRYMRLNCLRKVKKRKEK